MQYPKFPERNELKLCRTGNPVLCFSALLDPQLDQLPARNSREVKGAAQLLREAGAVFRVCCGVASEQKTCGAWKHSVRLGVTPAGSGGTSAGTPGVLEQKL